VIVLEILLLILLHVAVLAGMVAILIGMGGNFILLGLALLTAWVGDFDHLSFTLWLGLGALAVFGEVVEALLGVVTARRFGATRWGMIGTLVGGLLGAAAGTAWLPVIGSLIGAILGAFAGAFLGEVLGGSSAREGARAGTGAFVGRVAATTFKMGVGVVIAFLTLKAAYPLL
jgi:uncharacterized protein YqgC (DUF456 family)